MRLILIGLIAVLAMAQKPGEPGEKKDLPEKSAARMQIAFLEWRVANSELEAANELKARAEARIAAAQEAMRQKNAALTPVCMAALKDAKLEHGIWDCLPDGQAVRVKADPPPAKHDSKTSK